MSAGEASILLIEDDEVLLRGFRRELEQLGWCVEVARTLEQAGRIASTRQWDAAIIDLQLPDGHGLAFLEQLSGQAAAPRVSVVVSGTLDVQTTVRAVRAGALDVLEKPVSAREVDLRLRQALRVTRRPADVVSDDTPAILGNAPAIRALREQIQTLAAYPDLPVLIVGETGTGKELVAEAIHRASRGSEPFVPVNVAAVPEALFEAELFGHEAGAYTGARGSRAGLLELAGAGTLFLDELGEMPSALQPKLLRVLETRTFRRVGGGRDMPFRARVISATHRNVSGADSPLRADLYYRLAGFIAVVPALRERAQDIDLLAQHFATNFAKRYARDGLPLTEHALSALHAYEWPGNVRELKAVIQQAAVAAGSEIGVSEIERVLRNRGVVDSRPPAVSGVRRIAVAKAQPLREMERQMVVETWQAVDKNLSEAARRLGLPRTTLRDKLKRFGLR